MQAQAISDADFEQLVAQLEQSPMGDRSVRIATAAQFCFFTSLQVSCPVAHTIVPQLIVQVVASTHAISISDTAVFRYNFRCVCVLCFPKQIPPALENPSNVSRYSLAYAGIAWI